MAVRDADRALDEWLGGKISEARSALYGSIAVVFEGEMVLRQKLGRLEAYEEVREHLHALWGGAGDHPS